MSKKTIQFGTILIFIFCFHIVSFAQSNFTTNEVRQFMSKGEQNGIEIILNGTNTNAAKDGLKKLAKKYKAKVVSEKKSPEILLDNAQISTVSANTVDIYVILTPITNGTKATFFTDLGGAFITSSAYGTQYSAMDAAVREFAQNQALTSVSDQLKSEEKLLKTMNKELSSLQKTKSKTLKKIEEAKQSIIKMEQEIVKNDADQAAKQQQISLQQQIIETVKSKRSSLKN